MFRFLVLSCVCIFASSLSAAEPNDRLVNEITQIKRQLGELGRRVNAVERALTKPTEDAIAIRFDRLRIPYGDAMSRDSARAEIAEKGRRTFFGGAFSSDIGWERISVENASEIESVRLRSTASRIPAGRMSDIIDDGNAFYILHVTSRSK